MFLPIVLIHRKTITIFLVENKEFRKTVILVNINYSKNGLKIKYLNNLHHILISFS